MAAPLEGIRVLDFGRVLFCPASGMLLGDLGADVLRIEPLWGESWRKALPERIPGIEAKETDPDHGIWLAVNRSKRDLAIDLSHEKGKEIIYKLVKTADVMMHNFRPAVPARMGLDYETVSKINPRIIYASYYPYGETGPMKRWAGADNWAQAFTGVIAYQGASNEHPYCINPAALDTTGCLLGTVGILTALLVRERTGEGQEITTNLMNAGAYVQASEITEYLVEGVLNYKMGRMFRSSFPIGPYPAKDRDVFTMFGLGENWKDFCQVLDIEHLATDPKYDTQEKREKHREELWPMLDDAFRKKTAAEWQQLFREAKMRCDPCLNHAELVEHPQFEANDMLTTIEHPTRGQIKMLGVPIKLKKTPGEPKRPPPLIGQHTKEILAEIGYSQKEIKELIEAKVVRTSPKELWKAVPPPED